LWRLAYLRESHVWYRLDLTREVPQRSMPPGLTIGRAGAGDLGLLDQLATVGPVEARRRLDSGAEVWIAREGDRAAFSCWIFHDRMPAVAAKGGWLGLPPRTVGLEDSVTSPFYRGRAVAPAAWSAIGAALSGGRVDAIVTKVEHDNVPCQRALEKIGFRPVAMMHLRRVGGRSRVEVRLEDGAAAAFLTSALVR
jgi:ribosomal protein S18 acetylase RimI-like enzyme